MVVVEVESSTGGPGEAPSEIGDGETLTSPASDRFWCLTFLVRASSRRLLREKRFLNGLIIVFRGILKEEWKSLSSRRPLKRMKNYE
jgi:hypothetical protein